MRSPTPYLRELRRSLKKAEMLVSGVDPNDAKTVLQNLKLRGYILLSHAVIEEYLENLTSNVALEARTIYKKNGILTHALVSLISSKLIVDVHPKNSNKLSNNLVSNIDVFSEEACSRFIALVNNNNGIKEKDQNSLLMPIGVSPSDVDPALMNALSNFGDTRGNVAHKFTGIQNVSTLANVKGSIDYIARDIEIYDMAAVKNLRKRAFVMEGRDISHHAP